MLPNLAKLVTVYYAEKPDPANAAERVAFGTSGRRGSALRRSFNEFHGLATAQAIGDYRAAHGPDGPLYLGIDTHAPSEPSRVTTLEVLAANGVITMVDVDEGYTPTPVVSHAILNHNRGRRRALADGIARPSGTEVVYKLYAESFRDREHPSRIQSEAASLLERVFEKSSWSA
jgi:phosphoglucomutase